MALRGLTSGLRCVRLVARVGVVVAVTATIAGSALARPLADSVSITSGPSGETTATSATFTFTGTGAVTGFRCQFDNARTASPCSSPATLSRLALGRHMFVVYGYRGDIAVGVSDRRTWTIVAPSAPPPPTSPPPTPPPPPPGELPPLARAIVGTPGDDVIEGTPGDDVILGLGGNDAIEGLGGDDTIIGGSGRDRIDGGPGDDRIVGGPGGDEIWGDAGDDAIFVVDDLPDTSVLGGAGRDRIWRDRADSRNRLSGEIVRLVLGGAVAVSDKNAIWTMDVNGANRKRLTLKKVVPGVVDSNPKWSPDGTRIAFQRTTNPTSNAWQSDIWVVNWDGTGATSVTSSSAYREQSPAWSPDGSRIAFYVEESAPGGSDEWLAHRAVAPGSPLWSVTGRNDFEDVEWRADGTYLYGGTCTGATGFLVRAAPWTNSAPTGFEKIPGAAVTDPGDSACDSELTAAPSGPFTLLFARQQRGYPSGTSTSVIRRKVDGSQAASPGEPVVVPPITFGGTDNGGTMPDWNGAGTGFVFVAAGAVWRAAADGFPRKTLGRGSQPDWR